MDLDKDRYFPKLKLFDNVLSLVCKPVRTCGFQDYNDMVDDL
jgi:hypothetical protein